MQLSIQLTLTSQQTQALFQLLDQHFTKIRTQRLEEINFQLLVASEKNLSLHKQTTSQRTDYRLIYHDHSIQLDEALIPYYLKKEQPPYPGNDMINEHFWVWQQQDATPKSLVISDKYHFLTYEQASQLTLTTSYVATSQKNTLYFTNGHSLMNTKAVMIELKSMTNGFPEWLVHWIATIKKGG